MQGIVPIVRKSSEKLKKKKKKWRTNSNAVFSNSTVKSISFCRTICLLGFPGNQEVTGSI